MNDSDATTVPPEHVGGEWSHGSRGKRTNRAARSDEHVLGGTSTRELAATTVPRNAVVDDSLTAKSAFTPITSSTTREHGKHFLSKAKARWPLTPYQHHERLISHYETTRQRSQFAEAQPHLRNAVSLSTPLLTIARGAERAVATTLDADTNAAATSLPRSGGSSTLKVNTNALNTRPIRQLSTLLPTAGVSALTCKTPQLESQHVRKHSMSAPSTRDVRLQLSLGHPSLNDTVADARQLEEHTLCAANAVDVIATSEADQHHGQNSLPPQQSSPRTPIIADYSTKTAAKSDKIPIRSVATANQPKCSVPNSEHKVQFQGGLEAEKYTGNGSSIAPQSSVVTPSRKKSRKRKNKNDDGATGLVRKPKTKAPRGKRAAPQPSSSTHAKGNVSPEQQENAATPLIQKTSKRKNKATPTTEKKTKKRRSEKAAPGVNPGYRNAVTGGQSSGREIREEIKSAQTPVARSAFLEKSTLRLPPPRESDEQYRARLRVGGDNNTTGVAARPRLAALNFGGIVGNVSLPPVPEDLLLRAKCKEQTVELDEGMAHEEICTARVDRLKGVSKAHQTEANTTMSEMRKDVTVQTSENGDDDRKVERHGCTKAVDSDDELRRLKKEVQMLRALLLWKEKGNADQTEKTVSNTNEETMDLIRLGCEEGSGPIERTLKAVRMVRLGELLSALDSDVAEACAKMGEMTKHVLLIRHEKVYEHCVYEGMQFIAHEMGLGAACDKSIESVLEVFDVVRRGLLAAWHSTRHGEGSAGDGYNNGRFDTLLAHVSGELREWMRRLVREEWACLSWSDTICCKMGTALRSALEEGGCARGSEALCTMFSTVLRETQPLLRGAVARDGRGTRLLCRSAELATCLARWLRGARGARAHDTPQLRSPPRTRA